MYACSQYSVVLPRTAAQVLMCPDGTFRTQHVTPPQPESGILRLSYFRTTKQNSPGLMQFANRNPRTTLHRETHITHKPAFVGQLMLGYIVYFQVVKSWQQIRIYRPKSAPAEWSFYGNQFIFRPKRKSKTRRTAISIAALYHKSFPPLIRQSLHTGIKRLNLP